MLIATMHFLLFFLISNSASNKNMDPCRDAADSGQIISLPQLIFLQPSR